MARTIWIEEKSVEFSKIRGEEIKKLIHRWDVYVKDIQISLTGNEYIDMIMGRDIIEEALNQLDKLEDTKELRKQLETVDEEFKKQIPTVLKKFGGLAYWPEYPKSY
jgi:hypothetical protein